MTSTFISRPPYNVVQPGAYSAVDASQLGQPNFGLNAPIVAVLGVTFGGQPNTPVYFKSPGQMQTVLRSGPGYDVARFAFDGGAQQVCVVRVGNSVSQGSLALAGTGTCVTLTSRDWGSWVNAITVTVAAGPIITLAYVDQFGNTFTEKWDLTGVGSLTNQKIADAINGVTYGYSQSNFVIATAGAGTLPLGNVASAPLTGGTDGTAPAAGDWTNGLAALESQDVDILVPATGDATVHAQVVAHVNNMSLPNARKERTALFGAVLGESVTQQVTRMASLRQARAQLVYPGIQDFNASGALTTYDPFYAAGKLAGMHAGLPDPATPLIHERVPTVGVETQLSTIAGGAIDQLLQAGVTPIAPAPGSGFWVVDSLSGYNLSDQVFRDFHKIRSADFVSQYMRHLLEEQFVGGKSLASTQNAIQQAAKSGLTNLLAMQVIEAFLLPVVSPGPNVNSWNVQLPVMLIDATKYIFITVALQPSSTTLNSTTTTDLG